MNKVIGLKVISSNGVEQRLQAIVNKRSEEMARIYFEKLNIIYGRNYSGKTTLSRIVRSLETGKLPDNCDNPNFTISFFNESDITHESVSECTKSVRVFNKDFIKDNLQFIYNQDGVIKPFAIIGEKNATIEKEIAKIEAELGSAEDGKETALYAQLKNEKELLEDADSMYLKKDKNLDTLLKDKATKQDSGIKYEFERYGVQNYNKSKLLEDIEIVLATSYTPITNEQKAEQEKLLNEQAKPIIQDLPTLKLSFNQYCVAAEELLSRKIGDSGKIAELLLDAILNAWVKRGYELHEHKRDTCAFCGNRISAERWDVLNAHFDEESNQLEVDIDQAIKAMEDEKQHVKDGFPIDKYPFYEKFHKQIEDLQQAYNLASEKYNEQLDSIIDQLTSRRKRITESSSFIRSEDKSEALIEILTKYSEIKNESNKFSEQLAKEQVNAKSILRLREVHDFCSIINYSELCAERDKFKIKAEHAQENFNETQNKISRKKAEIESKKRLLSDEEMGASKVNNLLNYFFGHKFLSLIAIQSNDEDSKRTHFEIVRNGELAYNLSEGECNLISFCYFVAKLEDIDTKGEKPIIWIDDPVSSLDGNHIFFVYSLLAAEIAEKGIADQLFISTHNLDFLKYLRRLKFYEAQADGKLKKKSEKQYFLVSRQGEFSTIEKLPRYLKDY